MNVLIPQERLARMSLAMNLAAADAHSIHAQLDALEVPRLHDDQKLTPSQRVAILVGAYKSACQRVAKGGA
jgi:hypothetical protein